MNNIHIQFLKDLQSKLPKDSCYSGKIAEHLYGISTINFLESAHIANLYDFFINRKRIKNPLTKKIEISRMGYKKNEYFRGIKCHVHKRLTHNVISDIRVVTPEFLYAETIRSLDLPDKIRYGVRLTGYTTLRFNEQLGLKPILDANSRIPYKTNKVAQRVLGKFASPPELQLFIMLIERGLPLPLVNEKIALPPKFPRNSIIPDFYWPAHNLVVEYQGKDYHSDQDSLNDDTTKINIYAELGLTVIQLTKDNVHRLPQILQANFFAN
ncbi:MAG: endonuclease domain-containing protein [Lactobacillales bacterium]|jgi:hypothetical protein|nr:endonuclease domain-containing protein [Lactobacillales bacterium]